MTLPLASVRDIALSPARPDGPNAGLYLLSLYREGVPVTVALTPDAVRALHARLGVEVALMDQRQREVA